MSRHHRRSIRLKGFDQHLPFMCFITIKAWNDHHRFGWISNNSMNLNEIGVLAKECWLEIPQHFPNVHVDEMIVMPNHVHGILHFNPIKPVGAQPLVSAQPFVGAQHAAPLQANFKEKAGPFPGSLGAVVRSYKAAVTKKVRLIADFPSAIIWQRNYYDRIIRDQHELFRFQHYIRSNLERWD